MATLVSSPSAPKEGDLVSFTGDGFTPGATVTVSITELDWLSEIIADAAGSFGTSDIADHATTVLSSTGNPAAAETVTIGSVTYTFRASVTTTANEVLIGANVDATLQNLKDAINLTGTPGTQYGSSTVIHPTVSAGAVNTGTHTLTLSAKTGGTGGNSLASTETSTVLSFPGATFNSGTPGTAATGQDFVVWRPTQEGTYTVTATDGTNTVSTRVSVWTR